jgi:hypothetical protein
MTIKRLNSPEGYNSGEYDPSDLSEWDVEKLAALKPDVCFYWYSTGSYCGAGQFLFRVEGKWHLWDGSHCSCYGPLEDVYLVEGRTLDEIEASCAPMIDQVAHLIAAAREVEKAGEKFGGWSGLGR